MLLEFALCCGTVALRKPGLDQRGDGVAAFKALRFVVEVKTDLLLQRCDGLSDAASLDQRLPLAGRDRRDHDAVSVGCREIAAECAVDVVAYRWAVFMQQFSLGQHAQV